MASTKYEWKKAEKAWFAAGLSPVEVEVPAWKFFVLEGRGDPNGEDFAARVEALYALAYGVRMAPKSGLELPGWFEYTVYPLEGVWDLVAPPAPGPLNKAELVYQIMVRQPSFVDEAAASKAIEAVFQKKKLPLVGEAKFVTLAEGRCVQMLHQGPYDTEPASFRKMQDFCRKQSLARVGHQHREIYLTDARKVAPEDFRTILRFPVRDHFSCD